MGAIVAAALFALVGVALLGYAIFSLLGGPTAVAPATATQVALVPSPIALPTTTPAPTAVPATATLPPTDTAVPASPTASAALLTITSGANIRSGPGLLYSIVGGAQVGETFDVVGRDSAATWFVINYAGGQGWVSGLVATFAGDVNSLPAIAAPPLPPTAVPSNTPVPLPTSIPPTVAPAGYFSHGIQGVSFSVENPNAAPNALVWFNFKVTNTSAQDVSYSVLAAHTDTGPNAKSWSDQTLKAGQTLEWRDHIEFASAGTYQLYLGICYGGFNPCFANQVGWDRLSANVAVTIK